MVRVERRHSALNELATIWRQADSASRQAITAATHALDEELQTRPEGKGESREAGDRILFAPPLGIAFASDTEQDIVSIWHVWCFRQRRE